MGGEINFCPVHSTGVSPFTVSSPLVCTCRPKPTHVCYPEEIVYPKPVCCSHCWHPHTGPIWMVIPHGKRLMECCHCGATKLQSTWHHYPGCRRPRVTWSLNGVPQQEGALTEYYKRKITDEL